MGVGRRAKVNIFECYLGRQLYFASVRLLQLANNCQVIDLLAITNNEQIHCILVTIYYLDIRVIEIPDS